jgi:hypothetical protein
MKLSRTIVLTWLLTLVAQPFAMAADDQTRIAELNQYWLGRVERVPPFEVNEKFKYNT